MPRAPYSRSRRFLMQVVLCLIFGASVALAALVTHERKMHRDTHLAGMQYVGNIGVRLPDGWRLDFMDRGSILFVASEPATPDKKGRRITIYRAVVDPSVSSAEFLERSGLLNGTVPMVSADPAANVADPITIAGEPGAMLSVKKRSIAFLIIQTGPDESELVAASVRPSGLAISLKLECPDEIDSGSEDEQTLRDIAAEIEVRAPEVERQTWK